MENNKNQVLIKDFDLFFEAIRASSKILESAKITVSDTGLTIYGVKDRIARCEIQSNAISATQEISFSILNLGTLVKVLQTIKEIHPGDFTDFKMLVD